MQCHDCTLNQTEIGYCRSCDEIVCFRCTPKHPEKCACRLAFQSREALENLVRRTAEDVVRESFGPLTSGANGRWETLTVADIRFLRDVGIKILEV